MSGSIKEGISSVPILILMIALENDPLASHMIVLHFGHAKTCLLSPDGLAIVIACGGIWPIDMTLSASMLAKAAKTEPVCL